jgi:hypothetical protein
MKRDVWVRLSPDDLQKLVYASDGGFAVPANRRPQAQWPSRQTWAPLGTVVGGSAVACSSSGRQLFPLCRSTPIHGRTQAAATGPRTARMEATEVEGWSSEGRQPPAEGGSWWEGIAPPPILPLSCRMSREATRKGSDLQRPTLASASPSQPAPGPTGEWWVVPLLRDGHPPGCRCRATIEPSIPSHGGVREQGWGKGRPFRGGRSLGDGACLARRGQRKPG